MSQNCKLIPAEPYAIYEFHSLCGKTKTLELHFVIRNEFKIVYIDKNSKNKILENYNHERKVYTYIDTAIVSSVKYWFKK